MKICTHIHYNHTEQGQRVTVLTDDTVGGHRTGNPSLPHFQLTVPPERKKKI